MTEQELNRAIQYVTASTSYSRETVAEIIRTGFDEMHAMASTTARQFNREDLVGYICQWTMKRTGHPEPLVREVLDGAGRWLDEVSRLVAAREVSPKKFSEGEEPGTEPVE
jgi:hypothetical protein